MKDYIEEKESRSYLRNQTVAVFFFFFFSGFFLQQTGCVDNCENLFFYAII